MMRCLAAAILLLASCQSKQAPEVAKEEPILWAPSYAYAKAYLYGMDSSTMDQIIVRSQLHPSVADSNGVKLSEKSAKRVEMILSGEWGENEEMVSSCFEPHHGIVFYNVKNKPVASVSICFMCNTMQVEPTNNLPTRGMRELRRIIEECGLPIFNKQEQYFEHGNNLKEKAS